MLQLEDSLASQNSLVLENAQLLERLQRVEGALKETREKVSELSPADLDSSQNKLAELEQKIN